MEDNDEDQNLPAKATDEDILKEVESGNHDDEEEEDRFIYFKSSSIISFLIIVIISLVCILATSLLIKTVLQSRGITRRLSLYFGFTSNRTIDESILTFWSPENIYGKQPIETTTTIMGSSSSRPPPPTVVLTHTERKAQTIFRNVVLPSLFLISIFCGIFAFYMRRHNHYYPAWGARPRKPKEYITMELKQLQTADINDHI